MFAGMFGRNEILELLVKSGANKEILDTRGLSVFDLAAQQGNEAGIAILEKN
jgi:ankyrin repeat protein